MLNKNLAGFFAFFLGLFGVHRFYLGQWFRGALQFGGFWSAVFLASQAYGEEATLFGIIVACMVIAPILTAIVFWATPEKKWLKKYDPESLADETPLGIAGPLRDAKALKAEGIRYYRTGDYDLAIEAFQDASESDLADPGTHFNLACSYAQLGQYGEALRHLELSVTFGLPKPERIEKHPALAALRKTPAFGTFRANNFRRLNLVDVRRAAPVAEPDIVSNEPAETLEDFATPPARPAGKSTETFGAASPSSDLLEQITRLRELHDAGVLTQVEYQAQKEKLMG